MNFSFSINFDRVWLVLVKQIVRQNQIFNGILTIFYNINFHPRTVFYFFSFSSWLYHDPQCGLNIFGHCAELKIRKAPKHDLRNLRPRSGQLSGNQNLSQYVISRLVVLPCSGQSAEFYFEARTGSEMFGPHRGSYFITAATKRTLPVHQKHRTVPVHDFRNNSWKHLLC